MYISYIYRMGKKNIDDASENLTPQQVMINQVPPRRSSSLASVAWDISEHVLQTLTSAAQYAPTPYLGTLSVVALNIFQAVQGAKENQEVLAQLASMACNLASSITTTYEELHSHSSSPNADACSTVAQKLFSSDITLQKQVDELIQILNSIEEWIQDLKNRGKLRKVIASRSDLNAIQEFRDRLKEATEKFQIQSLITLRSAVAQIEQQATKRHEAVRQKLVTIQEHLEENARKPVYVDSPISSEPNSPFSSHCPSRANTTELVGNPNNPFSPLLSRSATVHGNISVTNISGNSSVNSYINNSIRENFGNVFNGNKMVFGSGMRRQQEIGAERGNAGNGGYNETHGYQGSYNKLTRIPQRCGRDYDQVRSSNPRRTYSESWIN
ncbi:hypothetical protein C8J55DRAFT_522701 [Lentinula edodes]|uniref:Uncharacterized protein n=1 Tax=Lentinula lateritia TaxID=40482 RepID=A0A9W9A084_9AGAR|nr:hypothetical protein C8J55DRAFT_522701 [Lentinula edodes]